MAKTPTISANDPCIFLMWTVVSCPAQVATEGQGRFISITMHLIQENLTRSCTKSSYRLSSSVAKLTTNYIGSILVPAIVADCSPQTLILKFYSSTHMRLITHQPNTWREISELSKQLTGKWIWWLTYWCPIVPAVTDRNKCCPLPYFWHHQLWPELASPILKMPKCI